jgi:bacterioferritin-associated ferredoxin
MAQLQACTGLGTQCGRCYETGAEVLEGVLKQCPATSAIVDNSLPQRS